MTAFKIIRMQKNMFISIVSSYNLQKYKSTDRKDILKINSTYAFRNRFAPDQLQYVRVGALPSNTYANCKHKLYIF